MLKQCSNCFYADSFDRPRIWCLRFDMRVWANNCCSEYESIFDSSSKANEKDKGKESK